MQIGYIAGMATGKMVIKIPCREESGNLKIMTLFNIKIFNLQTSLVVATGDMLLYYAKETLCCIGHF